MNDKEQFEFSSKIYVNPVLWDKIKHDHTLYAIKLRNGEVRNRLFIRPDGLILGKAVGGRQEYDYNDFDFTANDIVAIKKSQGLLTPFIPWIR